MLITFQKKDGQHGVVVEQQKARIDLHYENTKVVQRALGKPMNLDYDTWDGPGAPSIHTWLQKVDIESDIEGAAIGNLPIPGKKEECIVFDIAHVEDVKELLKGFLMIWEVERKLDRLPNTCNHLCCKFHKMNSK